MRRVLVWMTSEGVPEKEEEIERRVESPKATGEGNRERERSGEEGREADCYFI